jgi:MYXO-CTERM domain-containing protein
MKAIALFVVAGLATAAQADIVAYWNFNGPGSVANTTGTNLGTIDLGVAQGAGTISFTGLTLNTITAGATNGTVGSFGGTTNNAISPDVAGSALSIAGGLSAGGSPIIANNGEIRFNLNLTGFASDLTLSYSTRGTGSGFTGQAWSFSTDGGSTFTPATSFNTAPGTSFITRNVSFPTTGALYGTSNVIVRVVLTGASSNTGNNRIDNVRFDATVPTPGAATLMGLGLVAAGRRRR